MNIDIKIIHELPSDFHRLIELSLAEDFYAMRRMRDDWDSCANKFDRPGETLIEARADTRLIGICGLNRDPYAQSAEIGRVRHLYVEPQFRRRGVGRLLVARIAEHASRHFSLLRLRTNRADADRFYIALGFRNVLHDNYATHELPLATES